MAIIAIFGFLFIVGYQQQEPIIMPSSMNISLPETLRDFVKERVKTDFHGTTSAYIQTLINEDRKRAAHERLETLILEGMNSGAATPYTKADTEDVRAAVKARLLANKPA